MEAITDPTPEQVREGNKVIKNCLGWIHNFLKDGSFLLEEREDVIKAYLALDAIMSEPDEYATEDAKHEKNKATRHGLAWIHYKLGVTPIKSKNLDDAQMARGILYSFCMDLQKKIELVEPPAVKEAQPEEPKAPYVIDVPDLPVGQVTQ